MKKSIDLLFVLLCFAFVIACQPAQNNSDDSDKMEKNDDDDMDKDDDDDDDDLSEVDEISRDTFHAWQLNWAQLDTLYLDTSRLKYFFVPKVDLEELLGEDPVGTHFYMGLQQIGVGAYRPHLMMVGTDATGAPMMNKIFDYSSACPPLCNVIE